MKKQIRIFDIDYLYNSSKKYRRQCDEDEEYSFCGEDEYIIDCEEGDDWEEEFDEYGNDLRYDSLIEYLGDLSGEYFNSFKYEINLVV